MISINYLDLVNMLMNWRHSIFNVFFGPRIQPGEENAIEDLARYIVRASFSQERMTYISEESKVLYQSKDGKEEKTFGALEWLAVSFIENPETTKKILKHLDLWPVESLKVERVVICRP